MYKNNKKKYIVAVVMLGVIFSVAYIARVYKDDSTIDIPVDLNDTPDPTEVTNSNESVDKILSQQKSEQFISKSNNIKEEAWEVFQNYLKAASLKDLDTLKKYTYKLSGVCLDPEQKESCEARMETVAFFGSAFQKEDFINIWSDERQIILATDYGDASDGEIYSRIRKIIYFIVDNGEIKLLRFSPEQGFYLPKDFGSKEEIDNILTMRTKDDDKDGIEDYIELCTDRKEGCIKSDQTLRDTDLNGLWDGIEAQLRKYY